MRVAVVIISDRVSAGTAVDRTGPELVGFVQRQAGWSLVPPLAPSQPPPQQPPPAVTAVVPDTAQAIQSAIRRLTDSPASSPSHADLVLTSGGTGFGVRDMTPEAVGALLDRAAPGLVAAVLAAGLAKTPLAALSRPVAGVRGHSVVLTLPGSVKGALESVEAVAGVLGHAVELAVGEDRAGEAFHEALSGYVHGTASASGGASASASGGHAHGHGHGGHNCSRHDHMERKTDSASASASAGFLSNDPSQAVTRRARVSPFPMISFDAALGLVLAHAHVLEPVDHAVNASLIGHILAADVVAAENVPAYRASIVDGYAVVAADGPGTYPLAGIATAGSAMATTTATTSLSSGFVSRIATGAAVPAGADAVVMIEATEIAETSADGTEERAVRITESVAPGQDIREIGSDVRAGETVLRAGQTVTAVGGEMGVLASVGVTRVAVVRKPVVALLSTGNEVVDAATAGPIPLGGIRDSNRPALAAVIAQAGYQVVDLGIASDDAETLAQTIRTGLEKADILITTGGVSMGEMDLLKPVLERSLGATIHFGRVALKPGKPTTFATIPADGSGSGSGHPKLVFALPGNPVSCLVTYMLFVVPALRRMAGWAVPTLPRVNVRLAAETDLDPRPEFHRARIVFTPAGFVAHSTGMQRSSRVQSMSTANALLALPAASSSCRRLAAGTIVEAVVIGDLA